LSLLAGVLLGFELRSDLGPAEPVAPARRDYGRSEQTLRNPAADGVRGDAESARDFAGGDQLLVDGHGADVRSSTWQIVRLDSFGSIFSNSSVKCAGSPGNEGGPDRVLEHPAGALIHTA
jgi:hypothetical protein